MTEQEIQEIKDELDKATYEYFEKYPDKLKNLFASILGLPIEPRDITEVANVSSLEFTMHDALFDLCGILRLPFPEDGTHRSIHISHLINNIQGWIYQQRAEKRADKMVKAAITSWRAAWFTGACAFISVIALLWATLFNPGRGEVVKEYPAAAVMEPVLIPAD